MALQHAHKQQILQTQCTQIRSATAVQKRATELSAHPARTVPVGATQPTHLQLAWLAAGLACSWLGLQLLRHHGPDQLLVEGIDQTHPTAAPHPAQKVARSRMFAATARTR
jgi:hypothetical protein